MQAILEVDPGAELTLVVGQGGCLAFAAESGGWEGGGGYGAGGATTFVPGDDPSRHMYGAVAGSGGGGSAILVDGEPLVVAGGGFGQGAFSYRDDSGPDGWRYCSTADRLVRLEHTGTLRRIHGARSADGTAEAPGSGGVIGGTCTDGDTENLHSSFDGPGRDGDAACRATGGAGAPGQHREAVFAPDGSVMHSVSGGGGGGYTGGGSGSLTCAQWLGDAPASIIFAAGGGAGGNYMLPALVTGVTESLGTNAPGTEQRGAGSIVLTYRSCID